MVVNHSVKLSFDFRLTRTYLKNCTLKKPIKARQKMRLKTALPTKKLYAYKSLSSRIFFEERGNLLALKKR